MPFQATVRVRMNASQTLKVQKEEEEGKEDEKRESAKRVISLMEHERETRGKWNKINEFKGVIWETWRREGESTVRDTMVNEKRQHER